MSDWKQLYTERKMTAEEAIKHIKNGDRVVIAHLVGAPQPIVDALAEHCEDYRDIKISQMLTNDGQPYADPKVKGHFLLRPMFVGKGNGRAVAEGYGDLIPTHFSDVPYLFENINKPDVALIQVCPPDEDGYVYMGLTADYTYSAAKNARTVIAEVNKQCPRVFGDTKLHVSEIECLVESDRPVVEIPPTVITETERKIAGYCAELVDDGACLQLGIGAIPDAVLGLLEDKKDLGIHSEIIGDGVQRLYEKGVINCSRKEIDTGKIVTTTLFGSKALLNFANNNPVIELRTVDYTNDVRVISQISNMVSINSCVEIDMMGQVASESVGMRQISGSGGQVDFVRGAKMSKGGKSIMACYSTAKGGTISKIVPIMQPGTPITTLRNDVDYVVTEYGIAHMRGLSLHDRARALIAVAHPDFRDKLKFDYEKVYGWKL